MTTRRGLFKYKIINITVLLTSLMILLFLGLSLTGFDWSSDSFPEKLTIAITTVLFLLKLICLIFILINKQIGILLLNIFYVLCCFLLILSNSIRFFGEGELNFKTDVILIFVFSILLCVINKFKITQENYISIDEIGKSDN